MSHYIIILHAVYGIYCIWYILYMVYTVYIHSHRISASEFQWIDFLREQFVVQVECGQQHTLCRAVSRQHYNNNRIQNSSTIPTLEHYREDPYEPLIVADMKKGSNSAGGGAETDGVFVGSKIGCDCYSWVSIACVYKVIVIILKFICVCCRVFLG